MRIFFVCRRVPFPPDRGDKIATYHHVRHLARNHAVSVACLADGPADLANVAGLEGLVTSVDAVSLSARGGRLRALVALATGRPLTLACLDEPAFRSRVWIRLAADRFDEFCASLS